MMDTSWRIFNLLLGVEILLRRIALADVEISYVLEPFDFPNTTGTPSTVPLVIPYETLENVTLTRYPYESQLELDLTSDALFGNGALQITVPEDDDASSDTLDSPFSLVWVDAALPFHCDGASHLSLWYKATSGQSALYSSSLLLHLLLYDDTECETECDFVDNLLGFITTVPVVVEASSDNALWNELKVNLTATTNSPVEWKTILDSQASRPLSLQNIRGWGLRISSVTGSPITLQIDHLACVGGGDLLGAMFRTSNTATFAESVAAGAWTEIYYRSERSQEDSVVRLTDDGTLEVSYAVEQTETWGGFIQFMYMAPGNSYYNVSSATDLVLDYRVDATSSAQNRAHLRVILADAKECQDQCRDFKNTETFYSFFYILDELGAGSVRVQLEGSEDPASPLWRTGWTGSAHNGKFDMDKVKGILFEISVDGNGEVGSLVSGSVAFGNLEVDDRSDDVMVGGMTVEAATVSLVLDSFEYHGLAPGQPGDELPDYTYTPQNVAFSSSGPNNGLQFDVRTTQEALFGTGALRVGIDVAENSNAERYFGELQWVATSGAYNCLGASAISLWFKFPSEQTELSLGVVLFDDSECISDCANTEKLRRFETEPVLLRSSIGDSSSWIERTFSLGTNGTGAFSLVSGDGEFLSLENLRGFGLTFSTSFENTQSVVLIDQLSCVGDGELFGSVFFGQNSFDDAIASDAWQADYSGSQLAQAETVANFVDDIGLEVDYTIEQTDLSGGFTAFSYFAPGNAFFDLGGASELLLDYKVTNVSTTPGRAHFRVILGDSLDCFQNCLDWDNLEAYYSFNYILDEIDEGTIKFALHGSEFPSSNSLWRTGWIGASHNGILDLSRIKAIGFQLSLDSYGIVSSSVSGSVSFGNLRVLGKAHDGHLPFYNGTAVAVIESDLHFRDLGYRMISFLDTEECMERCLQDEYCLFGYVALDYRDCFLGTSDLESSSIFLSSSVLDDTTNIAFWIDDPSKRGDFCELCACDETDRMIDCRGRDISVLPKVFSPTSWTPRSINLQQNPRLTMIGTDAFQEIATTLEEIFLPESLRFLSPGSIEFLPALQSVFLPADLSWDNHGMENVIGDPSAFFGDICCDMDKHVPLQHPRNGLWFCDVEVSTPGIDSTYRNFSQIIQADVVTILTQSSGFAAEASESPQKCAQYCSLYPDCLYFTYDSRYNEAQHRCYLLSNNGTHSEDVCCHPGDYANLEGTLPGFTSGASPRARHEVFNATVAVSTTALKADAENSYTVQYNVRLGSQPIRGAVWITPTLESASNLEHQISPEKVPLYDGETTAVFTISISNPEILDGRGETLVISNHVESCDKAFVALGNEAKTVFVQILVPQRRSSKAMLLLVSVLGTLLLFSTLATIFIWDRRRQLLAQMKNDELDSIERDEEMEVRKIIRTDDILLLIGRLVMFSSLSTVCVAMTLWANRILAELDLETTTTTIEVGQAEGKKAYVVVLAVMFLLLLVFFSVYDWLVRRRNRKLVFNAAKASELVTNMFPDQVRERILNETRTNKKRRLEGNTAVEDAVLAELYPNTSLFFSDIAGFTAWSSSRQPQQVFILLEQVFGIFDTIAREHKVYKVESVGDSYLAIAGAPLEREDHAEAICLFAASCLRRFSRLSQRLVVSLGPDTSELQLRVGIHSGQVVFGVLRNERARYQLFGDTV